MKPMARGRKTGGRGPGSLNKKTLARLADKKRQIAAIESGEAQDPLDHLLQSMRDPLRSPQERDQAAAHALPYLKPKLSAVDLHSKNENVTYILHDMPLSAEEWLQEVGQPVIEGRGVPMATTLHGVHAIELEVRDRKIEMLTAEIEKLKDALTLSEAREAQRRAPYPCFREIAHVRPTSSHRGPLYVLPSP
jgi:hypothetical protein